MRARLAVALAALVALLSIACASAPKAIRDELAVTERVKSGAVTVVFFTDFQCPFCRRTHAELAPLLAARHGRVRLVLRHVPLPSHPDAATAARAAVCVERLTPMLVEDYAHALFSSPDLSEAACEELAVERGVERARFQRCLADASTAGRIRHDIAAYLSAGGDGVPLLYVDKLRLDGAQSRAELEAALDEALGAR